MITRQRADGLFTRLLRRRRRRPPLDPADPSLVVVAESFDDAEACSAVLARASSFDAAAEAVLRHHLAVPPDSVETVVSIAAQDGYTPADAAGRLILQRVQLLDALHCAQERSRMVGLAQRYDGTFVGWDALQPNRDSGRSPDVRAAD